MGGILFDRGKSVLNPESLQPTYLVMSRSGIHADKGFSNVSPFLIQKSISAVGGNIIDCKKLRSGQLLIQCTNGKQANKIIQMLSLSSVVFVNVEEHKTLNMSKGIIYTNDLRDLSDTELKEEITKLNLQVTDIKRLKRRDPETRTLTNVDSGLYILTFNTRDLPENVFIGFFRVKVRHYIPNPLRCYNCFQFGHVSEKCTSNVKLCPHCSNTVHTEIKEDGKREKCNNTPKCANCGKEHNSFSKECTTYKREFAIQTIRIKEKKSIHEARKIYEMRNPLPTTYSDISKLPTINKQCSCECRCKQNTREKNITQTEKTSPTKTIKEALSTISSIREVKKTDGTKISLIPKGISKRKKRELTNTEKKEKTKHKQ